MFYSFSDFLERRRSCVSCFSSDWRRNLWISLVCNREKVQKWSPTNRGSTIKQMLSSNILAEGESRAKQHRFSPAKHRGLSKFPFEKWTTTQSGDKSRDRITRPVCLFRGFSRVLKIIALSFLKYANEVMFTFLIRCLNKDKTCSRKTASRAIQTHPLSLSPKTWQLSSLLTTMSDSFPY